MLLSFALTPIADASPASPYSGLVVGQAINDLGQVAFVADLKSGGEAIYRTEANGRLTTIAHTNGLIRDFYLSPYMNDSGTVVFGADLTDGTQALFTGTGDGLTRIAGTGPDSPISSLPPPAARIGSDGTVCFQALLSSGGKGFFKGDGGLLSILYVTGGRYSVFPGSPASQIHGDTVAFRATLTGGPDGVFRGDGLHTETIVTAGNTYSSFLGSEINDEGTVGIIANLTAGGQAIVIAKDGTLTTFVDTSGPFSHVAEGKLSISNLEGAVFGADLAAGGTGIFNGPDPVADKVLATGDALLGSTVADFPVNYLNPRGLNNAGQVIFRVNLADGRTVLVRADPALPSTLTVLNNHDSGAGSLRAEIAAAHNGDTIRFDHHLRGQTITLTSGELVIDKSLDIEGLGASKLTVSGNGASRVFDLTGSGLNVTIAGLTIADGLATQGGGIENVASNLTLSRDVLSNDRAVGDPGENAAGGGLFNGSAAILTVAHSTFTGDLAQGGAANASGNAGAAQGGAIYNEGVASVRYSSFRANQVHGGDGGQSGWGGNGQGGGIFNLGTLTVRDSVFASNQAFGGTHGRLGDSSHVGNGAGAGVYNQATLTVRDSSFAHNHAFGGAGYDGVVGGAGNGGGILSAAPPDAPEGATAIVTHSAFVDNQTTGGTGGAGAAGGGASAGALLNGYGTFTITHSTFNHNQATGGVGGMGGAGGTASGGVILNNARDGDAVMTISHSTLTDNRAIGGTAGLGGIGGTASGGGIAILIRTAGFSASVTVTHSTLVGNEAVGGGGIGGIGQGGAIANLGGPGPGIASLSITHSILAVNDASGGDGSNGGNGWGGGLYVTSGMVSIEHSSITANQALGGAAGAGATDGQGVGGGVYVAAGTVCVHNVKIKHNEASTSDDDVFGDLEVC
jgi:hypothetical protein